MRVPSDRPTRNGGWVHLTDETFRGGAPLPPRSADVPPASVARRDAVYRELLRLCPPGREHRMDLLRRGLPEPFEGKYGTLPLEGRREIVERLELLFDLEGVPGFWHDGRRWCLAGPPGLLVPALDPEGRIQGLQVRVEREGRKAYPWLTSRGREGGSSPGAPWHVAGRNYPADRVVVTEGFLKADVTAHLLGMRAVGVPGVTCWRGVPEYLETLKPVLVILAWDYPELTVRKKEPVRRSLYGFAAALREKGLKVAVARWDPSWGKGIDDVLAGGRNIIVDMGFVRRQLAV
ncbi:DUF3854 domain-containing protein [Thermodesulfitimonas sp.]